MSLIRMQNKVPVVYVDESRDFQLFCRVLDVLFNGVKYDIDGIERLINTHSCKSTVLQLLQTKEGFFTNKNFTDETLRYILEAFLLLVRGKGTSQAIEKAVYLFLKINHLETSIKVDIINSTPTREQKREFGSYITDHCVVIGIESSVRDTTSLYEVLKYIVPFGYNIFFYFFVGEEKEQYTGMSQKADVLYVSNDVNSPMLGSEPPTGRNDDGTPKTPDWDDDLKWFTKDIEKRRINSINSLEIVPQGLITNTNPDRAESPGVVVDPDYENTVEIKTISENDSYDK